MIRELITTQQYPQAWFSQRVLKDQSQQGGDATGGSQMEWGQTESSVREVSVWTLRWAGRKPVQPEQWLSRRSTDPDLNQTLQVGVPPCAPHQAAEMLTKQ